MTTESNDHQTNTSIDINKLIDKPYSEMTDEEIDAIVEYKAQVKARDEQFQKVLDTIKANADAQLKVMQETAEKDAARQDALLQASIERLKKAEGAGA